MCTQYLLAVPPFLSLQARMEWCLYNQRMVPYYIRPGAMEVIFALVAELTRTDTPRPLS